MDNNEKRVRIMTETQIEDLNGDIQQMRHAGYGTVQTDGDCFHLSYTDRQGQDTTNIVLSGSCDRIIMERDGEARGTLDFCPGTETVSLYILQYGEIEIHIRTDTIECQWNETEGSVILRYFSGMNGIPENRTRYSCRWKY